MFYLMVALATCCARTGWCGNNTDARPQWASTSARAANGERSACSMAGTIRRAFEHTTAREPRPTASISRTALTTLLFN